MARGPDSSYHNSPAHVSMTKNTHFFGTDAPGSSGPGHGSDTLMREIVASDTGPAL